ncbi:dihydroorotase [Natranaerovirga pectinivora]|uniref:Dihydroorotase n=1 Tax=Natranaerovirga pectinivora TaxID=682400 RepID=A0A4R3MLG1_9FIRM|nr:dihydroorotase [Natranaerovirga pectinivora]TCT14944.1 dihydroorotase [Natranaerovirga pectinivora]
MKLLIKNGIVYESDRFKDNIDIYIENGKITAIGKELQKLDVYKVIDASECYVIPGLVDMHCTIGEPGYEYKETLETASISAARGGFTSITMNPDTSPTIDNKTVVEFILSKAREDSCVNIFPYGSMTKKCEGKELAEIGDMQLSGVCAISDGDKAIQDANVISKIIKYAKMFDMPIITHCEDTSLSFSSGVNEGKMSTYLGLKGALRTAEEIMVARNILLADYYKAHIHITHISTKKSVELIKDAKRNGVNITAETSPHYFMLNEDKVQNYNAFAKVNPPLRTEEDVNAIIQGIKEGIIDVISSDHKPNTIDSKLVEFELASFGMSSLEIAFPLAYTALVSTQIITLEQLIHLMSKKPAEILGLNKGVIKVGADADLIVIKKEEKIINSKGFLSKSKFTPFDGFKLDISIKNTIVDGKDIDLKISE